MDAAFIAWFRGQGSRERDGGAANTTRGKTPSKVAVKP